MCEACNLSEEPKRLAEFQATMLDHLSKHKTFAALQEAMRADPKLDAYREYVESFEPDMLMIAAELTKKWGVRK